MILAHAFYPGTGRGGDVHLDEEEDWTARTLEGIKANFFFNTRIFIAILSLQSTLVDRSIEGFTVLRCLLAEDKIYSISSVNGNDFLYSSLYMSKLVNFS